MADREKTLFRYTTALDQGDFEAVENILALAEQDVELEKMILEINEVLQAEVQPGLWSNESIKRRRNTKRKRRLLWVLAPVAAMLVLAVIVGPMWFLGQGDAERMVEEQLLQEELAAMPTMTMMPTTTSEAWVRSDFGNTEETEGTAGDDSFYQQPQPTNTDGVATTPLPAQERMIIKNGEMTLLVEDVDVAVDRITQIAVDNGGYVLSSQTWANGPVKAGTIKIAVEVGNFETTMRRLGDIALEVLQESAVGQDVSEEYVDLQSRLRNLEATRDRLRDLLEEASDVDEALKVNTELSNIEGQIEQVLGRMQFLSGRAAYSTITIDLQEPAPTPTPTYTPSITPSPTATYTSTPWMLNPHIEQAKQSQLSLARWLAEVVTWVVIVPGPYLVVGVIIWLAVRRVRRS